MKEPFSQENGFMAVTAHSCHDKVLCYQVTICFFEQNNFVACLVLHYLKQHVFVSAIFFCWGRKLRVRSIFRLCFVETQCILLLYERECEHREMLLRTVVMCILEQQRRL